MRLLIWLAVFSSSLVVVSPAKAFIHIVQPGDTLASIAERFYGKVQQERLLVVANALEAQGGTHIIAGMRLEVPALTYIRIEKGETWKSLAARLLGGEHRAHALAAANDSQPWLPPDTDAEVIVPYNLRFIATGNETIVGLAYQFLGDRKKGWMLHQYNDRKGQHLQRGDVILIPISDIELTAAGKSAVAESSQLTARQGGGKARAAQAEVQRGLIELTRHSRSGQYVEVVRLGNQFLSRELLTQKQRALIHRFLLEAYAALGATGQAAEACRLWMKDDPGAKPDPIQLSPKLISACQRGQQ